MLDKYQEEREKMVAEQLVDRDITDSEVLHAFLRVQRHLFVPEEYRNRAYQDNPLPIGHNQTISQPYVVAFMLSQLNLQAHHKVLEIGSGSGYVAALLAEICADVVAVERVPQLAETTKQRLDKMGYKIKVVSADGTLGYAAEAPFDRIVVSAAAKHIPRELIKQLRTEGSIILPFGEEEQKLLLLHKTHQGIKEHDLGKVSFVPLISEPS